MNCQKYVRALVALLALVLGVGYCALTNYVKAEEEISAQRDTRMGWWREARFGMFIHWGVYSVPAGTYNGKQVDSIGEWIMNLGRIPVARYMKYAEQFNPVKFNADEWVALAKEAGQKYIVITSKHHDGFAMFHSYANSFNIYDATPFKRDPIKELAEACQKQGIRLGLYYSQAQDWTAPGGAAHRGHWDRSQDGDMDKYIDEKAVPQVKEILTNYGPIAVLWWDTPTDMTPARAKKFAALLKLQPGIITNNRLGGGIGGDLTTPEQHIPVGKQRSDWETCMSMNDTWGFKSYDTNWKSTETLLRNLIDIASKGGNYLLNVGPTSEGLIPAASVERLKEVGKWMTVNGDSIYATTASPFGKTPAWGRITQKPGKLYLQVFNWPADHKLVLDGLATKVDKAWLLSTADHPSLSIVQHDSKLTVTLPEAAPDPLASVIVLEFEGDVNVTASVAEVPGESKSAPKKRHSPVQK